MKSILIVDDDEMMREVLAKTLSRLGGYECVALGDPLEALPRMKTRSFDCVVTDIDMPGMDGLELCREVKKRGDVPVVIITGTSSYSYEQIIDLGASDFLLKPIRPQEFLARLKRVLQEHDAITDRQRSVEDLAQSVEHLRRVVAGIVEAMSLAIEMRDPYTAGHQKRTAEVACAIAEAMGLPEDRVLMLRMAAMIHDLGKIAVPAEILSKPGALSDLEMAMVRSHVQAGYDILSKVEFPWPLATIVLQHHERIDGSGYPNGLTGAETLPEARILAVADVVETMASHRPYRPSRGVSAAMDELRRYLGTHYDADAANACLELVAEGRITFT